VTTFIFNMFVITILVCACLYAGMEVVKRWGGGWVFTPLMVWSGVIIGIAIALLILLIKGLGWELFWREFPRYFALLLIAAMVIAHVFILSRGAKSD